MNGECLSHLLTEAERKHFEEQGYLYVPNALSSEMVEHLTNAVDKLHNYRYILCRVRFNPHLVNVNGVMYSYTSG